MRKMGKQVRTGREKEVRGQRGGESSTRRKRKRLKSKRKKFMDIC